MAGSQSGDSNDYVLGTHREEIERLGIQHRVWRSKTLDCWQRAGLKVGHSVLDVGAGPGFATMDFAELVGKEGMVCAFERSDHFVSAGRQLCNERGLSQVKYVHGDLMLDDLPEKAFDLAWIRWVLCFLPDPALAVKKVAKAIKPGGKFVIQEYAHYETARSIPPRSAVDAFIDAGISSWRESGGEPNIGLQVPTLLLESGFRVLDVEPIVLIARPNDYSWLWPTHFITSQVLKLVEEGLLPQSNADEILGEWSEATADPNSMLIAPMVFQVIAEKLPI